MAACRKSVLFLLLVCFIALPAAAQTVTGSMNGTVTDRTGAALPGVTVTIRNVETGLERVAITNEAGAFNAPFLPIGRYNVTAELAGLGTARRDNVPVSLNETTRQDFIVDPAMAETITVNAEAPRVNVTDGEIKQTMRDTEIMSLPVTDQTSFLRLATVFSGYQENPTSGQDNPTLSSGSSVNFNGGGTRGTTFQINGVNNDDSSENQNRQGAAVATIKSFQVISNNFTAEFGRGSGSVVLVQTKSGTNELAGEVYGYFQDNKYNAKRALQEALARPINHRYQFGATSGFPIFRDRLFAFVNYDEVENQGENFVTRGVFTSEITSLPRLTRGNDTPANRAFQDAVMARFPQAAPNAPNTAGRGYTALVTNDFPTSDYSGRLDFNMNNSNTITARYQKSHQQPTPGELIIGDNALQDNRQSNLGMTYTNILSSNTVQEARYGLGMRSTNVNISGGNDTPVVRINGTGVPTFTILGNAGAFPIIRNQRDHQLVYNIQTARWATHTLKVGTDIRRSNLDDISDNFSRGFWTFNAACGGVTYPTGLHAFWDGCVSSYQKGYGPFNLKNDLNEANFYVQDDWRPWDNLTLNLGVRYEMVDAPSEEDDKIDYVFSNNKYIDPRFGFAYTPNWGNSRFMRAVTGGNGRFSIRGGYGISHGRVFQSVFSQGGANVRFNPPNALLLALANPFNGQLNVSDPTLGFSFTPGVPPTARYSAALIDPDLEMPESRQWNLTFERQVGAAARLRLSYIGNKGVNLLRYDFDNLPVVPAPFGTAGAPWVLAADPVCAGTTAATVNAQCPVVVPIGPNEVSLRVPRTNERRPSTCCTTNLITRNGSKSDYHGGQLEMESGLWHGLQGRVTYTYSKLIDEGSEATALGTGDINIFPPDNERYRRGLSRFDTRHRFTMSGSYQIPFLRDRQDWLGTLAGGWTVSTLIRLSSGTPFTLIDTGAVDFDFDGVANQRPVCVDKNYCGGWMVNVPGDSRNEIPRTAFRRGQYGDTLDDLVGRNTFFTDGFESVDLGLYKSFRVGVGLDSIMLRLDAFNVFNHTTWGFPTNDFASANFGIINTTHASYNPRTLQLGVRLIY